MATLFSWVELHSARNTSPVTAGLTLSGESERLRVSDARVKDFTSVSTVCKYYLLKITCAS
eukprot:4660132-Pyramimonas_sp.AAC.1